MFMVHSAAFSVTSAMTGVTSNRMRLHGGVVLSGLLSGILRGLGVRSPALGVSGAAGLQVQKRPELHLF
uniref:Secreted protein n=1 Tax=Knipowitschia caucasica TaxID=637954 RepID=A0AAV2LW23_KNICA